MDVTSDETIRKIVEINLTGPALGCRRACKVMKGQGTGMIVNISSVCAIEAWHGFAAYAATKAGLNTLSRSLYVELHSMIKVV